MRMRPIGFILMLTVLLTMLSSCEEPRNQQPLFEGEKVPQYPVGSIQFDLAKDDPDFSPCNKKGRVYEQYQSGARFGEGLKSLRTYLLPRLPQDDPSEGNHGYLTIRFVVNCKGERGWYRQFHTDSLYQPRQFGAAFSDSLEALVRAMPAWDPGSIEAMDQRPDSYAFITFKIRAGKIIDILP